MRLLLLPGMDGTGRLFAPLIRELPKSIVPEVVSYPADSQQGYAAIAAQVRASLEIEGDVVIVAESFSGPVAVLSAETQPSNLRGIVLCATFVRCPLPVATFLRWHALSVFFRFAPNRLICRFLLGGKRSPELHREVLDAIQSVPPATMAARAREVAKVNVTAELKGCSVPILYLRALDDWLVRSSATSLVQKLRPDLTLVELPGPHLILQTMPKEAAEIIASFCERVNRIRE